MKRGIWIGAIVAALLLYLLGVVGPMDYADALRSDAAMKLFRAQNAARINQKETSR